MDLRANPEKRARGVVIEAKLERGRGPVATVLVKEGTLRAGDSVVAGQFMGRVRMMNDHRARRIDEAGPSMAVEVVGLSGVPQAGDPFNAVKDEKAARQVSELRAERQKAKDAVRPVKPKFEDLHQMIQSGEIKELNLVLKADVQGSLEALSEALLKQSTDEVKVAILHASVGAINETDVNLASASNAIIIGFSVRPVPGATTAAEREGVEIKLYTIIYDVVNEVRAAMAGLLEPKFIETVVGRVEVRQVFTLSKVGTIAGSYVVDGKVRRGVRARLIRDGAVITESRVGSLRRFKEDAREVAAGLECGVGLENYGDVKVGDVIEVYELEEVAPEL
jgi:translation initiation factor IF-2